MALCQAMRQVFLLVVVFDRLASVIVVSKTFLNYQECWGTCLSVAFAFTAKCVSTPVIAVFWLKLGTL